MENKKDADFMNVVNIDVVRAEAVKIAKAIINKEISPIIGSRILDGMRQKLGINDNDPIFDVFLAIDSETDALPIVEVRKYWAEDALKNLDEEILKANKWALDVGMDAFQAVIKKWE